MRNVVIVTAKGGNQSIPDKNVMLIRGKPAVGYAIEAALNASEIDGVFVSTECSKIRAVAEQYGCSCIDRPPELATPDANHGDVIRHAVEVVVGVHAPELKNVTVLLGNTVMITPELIDLSLRVLRERVDADSVMSVWLAQDDHPYRALEINESGYLKSFLDVVSGTSRQAYPTAYFYDQGVWTFRKECVYERRGPNPWWWMGAKSVPIIRRWVTGRDVHSSLDVAFAEYWLDAGGTDVIENEAELKGSDPRR